MQGIPNPARRPRLVFVCGREPEYVRNHLLVRALGRRYPLAVVASSARSYPRRFAAILPRLALAARGADLIVAGFLGQPLALAARLLGKPVLLDAFVSIYDTLCLDRKALSPGSLVGQAVYAFDRAAMRASGRVLVDTASQRAFFADAFDVPAERLHVHYLGPDLDRIASPTPRRDGDAVNVLHYGSFLPLHGMDYVLEAANLLRGDSGIRFTIIGTGPRAPAIRERARRLGLTNVRFVDWLPVDELTAEVGRATIGLGGHFADNPKARRVIAGKTFQMMAAGLPTIVGDCPANREIFEPERHVQIVPMANATALAQAIQQLARRPDRREQLGREGSDLMRRLFAEERVGADLARVVDAALDGSGSATGASKAGA